jgi:hypothetical protein
MSNGLVTSRASSCGWQLSCSRAAAKTAAKNESWMRRWPKRDKPGSLLPKTLGQDPLQPRQLDASAADPELSVDGTQALGENLFLNLTPNGVDRPLEIAACPDRVLGRHRRSPTFQRERGGGKTVLRIIPKSPKKGSPAYRCCQSVGKWNARRCPIYRLSDPSWLLTASSIDLHLTMIDAGREPAEHCTQAMLDESSHRCQNPGYTDYTWCRQALLHCSKGPYRDEKR